MDVSACSRHVSSFGLAIAAFAVSTSPVRARAEPQQHAMASLEWGLPEDGEECIQDDALRQAVEERLGRPVFVDGGLVDVEVRGAIEGADGDRWMARVELATGGQSAGSRVLLTETTDCHDLDDVVPLVMALMIDLTAEEVVVRVPPRPAPPQPEPESAGEIDTSDGSGSAAPENAEEQPSERSWGWAVGVGGTAAFGMLPGVLFGLWNTWSLIPPRGPLVELRGVFLFPREHWERSEGSESRAWQLGLAACPALVEGRWIILDVCGGIEAGMFTSRGLGLDVNREVAGALVDVFGEFRLHLRLVSRLEIRLGVGLGVPLIRHRFAITAPNGEEEIFQADSVFERVDLGLVLRWRQ